MKRKQILVVEDERIVAEDIKMSLERLEYSVPAKVFSGVEAIKKAHEINPDLVLMDIVLEGGMDGIEAASTIRSRFNIPVVYLTAYSDKKTLDRAKVTEPFGYVLKPFEDKELQTTIEIALYKHRMERRLKKAQQELIQSEKLAALGMFSSGIAHEIRNPLGIILGGLEFLETKLPQSDSGIKITIDKIKESTRRANNIVESLLKFARPHELKTEKIKPNDLVNEALSLLKYRIPLKNIKIKTCLAKKDLLVKVDKDQILQILFNLFMNAIEAMPKGGAITIKTYKTELAESSSDNRLCVIEIMDTGEGISKDNLQKLFEPFFTTRRDKKGTGLGLFMAKMIANSHKGDLVIDSNLRKGTTAKIILPLSSKEVLSDG